MEEDVIAHLTAKRHARPWLLGAGIGALCLVFGGAYLVAGSASKAPSPTLPPFHPTQTITVDIEGAVARPGIFRITMPIDGALRIADVIASSGGLLSSADTDAIAKTMNLASPVQDGAKLYIPKKGESTQRESVMGIQTVNVNGASQGELENLTGIGASRARMIISKRPYTSLADLSARTSISLTILKKIEHEISF